MKSISQRILLIQTAFLGDLILTTPMIRAIKEQYPNSHLSVVINQGTEDILSENPNIDEIILLDKKEIKKSPVAFLRFIRQIRQKQFTICIAAHFSYRSSLISYFSGADKRIGYQQSGFSFLHTKVIDRPRRGPHEVDKLFSLLDHEQSLSEKRRPQIFFQPDRLKKFQAKMQMDGLMSGRYLIIAPSSVWQTKRMPVEKFCSLIDLLATKTDRSVVLIGSAKDNELAEEILEKIIHKNIYNYCGQTTLKELAYLISGAACVVSNDSSPIHFASAFNIPTVAIFGATITEFGYTPLATKQYIAEVEHMPCRPCGIHGGHTCPQKHFHCMQKQDIERMVEEIDRMLQ